MKTQTQARPVITDFPVRQETNKERIIRFFREHDGERACYERFELDDAHCAVGLLESQGMIDSYFFPEARGLGLSDRIADHFDDLRGSFGDFARHLEGCEECWGPGADEPYTGD